MYKIKKLVEDNYDFSAVSVGKQDEVRAATDLDFDLGSIVKFLQKQTNNFTVENTIAKDLDDAIYKVVEQYESEKGGGKKEVEVEVEEEVSDKLNPQQIADLTSTLEGMELAFDDLSEEDKEIYEILKEQLEEAEIKEFYAKK